MLRIGLTGNLGSGKSTAGALFAAHGADLLASDAIALELMQPGESVFDKIVALFGPGVLARDGLLDRAILARIAFVEGRAEELNAIVHPAVIARQAQLAADLFTQRPRGILIVESALIFETKFGTTGEGGGIGSRFDQIILVTASERAKLERFVRRQHPDGTPTTGELQALEAEARRRLALQIPDAVKAPHCDYILANDGTLEQLRSQVDSLWPILEAAAAGQMGHGEVRPESLQ